MKEVDDCVSQPFQYSQQADAAELAIKMCRHCHQLPVPFVNDREMVVVGIAGVEWQMD